jgi:hypothetical protein
MECPANPRRNHRRSLSSLTQPLAGCQMGAALDSQGLRGKKQRRFADEIAAGYVLAVNGPAHSLGLVAIRTLLDLVAFIARSNLAHPTQGDEPVVMRQSSRT